MSPTPVPASGHLQPTHVSVTFKIVTPDQLRKITFTLTRKSDSQTDSWSIAFELDERAKTTDEFAMLIQLDVDVDHNDVATNAQAVSTAKHGLDADQQAQALVAGDTAKAAADPTSGVTEEDADEDALGVVSARSAESPA